MNPKKLAPGDNKLHPLMESPQALRSLAEAAIWTGRWYYAGCNTVHCTYGKEDASLHDEIAHPCPEGVAQFIAAVDPSVVIALLDRIACLECGLDERVRTLEAEVALLRSQLVAKAASSPSTPQTHP